LWDKQVKRAQKLTEGTGFIDRKRGNLFGKSFPRTSSKSLFKKLNLLYKGEYIKMEQKYLDIMSFTREELVKGEIRGVMLSFHGLGCGAPYGPSAEDVWLCEKGILPVHPFYGPWGWMNRTARALTDEIVDAVYKKYKLDKDKIPLFSSGGSMGGHAALTFARYTKHKLKRVLALCPVCDLEYHFTERSDTGRGIYYSLYGFNEPFDKLIAESSPVKFAADLPRVPYLFIHGDKDTSVNKAAHSDAMVREMKKHGHNVEYIEIAGYGHGGVYPQRSISDRVVNFIADGLDG
jgi:pimeloyl-ACP methyl ester carboxylesterase